MKIASSNIAMASAHQETSYSYKESVTIEAAKSKDAPSAILTISAQAEGKSSKEVVAEYQKQQKDEAKRQQKESLERSLQRMAEQLKAGKMEAPLEEQDGYDKIKMLKQILAALRGEKIPDECKFKHRSNDDVLDLRSARYRRMEEQSFSLKAEGAVTLAAPRSGNGAVAVGTTSTGTTWQRITATSGFAVEAESTTFATTGMVKTQDGRSIGFNVEVSMSRAFMSSIDALEVRDYIKTDPLMINLDTNIGSVSDQKFYFDLDSDGKEENISFAGKGSGFLALDKNGDGKINDGSELFGTKSGDGFKDLAAYDEDGNGWIDENDSVFSKLKVWTKDEDGNDYLMDLKSADVGAIYLGNVDTQFSLKDSDNNLNAEIKKTGIYLKESTGFVGTLNHIDLAV